MRIDEYKIISKFMDAQIKMRTENSKMVFIQLHDHEIELLNHILWQYKKTREAFEHEQIREEYNRLLAECGGEESDQEILGTCACECCRVSRKQSAAESFPK